MWSGKDRRTVLGGLSACQLHIPDNFTLARISHKGIRSSPSWHDNWRPVSNLANLRRTSRPEHCVSDGLPADGIASCSLPAVSAVQPVVLCTLCEKCGLGASFRMNAYAAPSDRRTRVARHS